MSYFSARVKELRTQHGLTQKQIADAIEISQGTYSGLESGKSDPSLDTLKALSAYYNEWIDSLVGSVRILSDDEEIPKADWRLLKKYNRLDATDKIKIKCIVDMKLERQRKKQED